MKTIRQILCPVDLARASRQAVQYATAMAKACEARLTVCHCLSPMDYHAEEKRQAAEDQLRALVQSSMPEEGEAWLDWEAVTIDGDPIIGVMAEAGRRGVDLIILESRRRPLGAAIFGSTAEAICREAICPVLVLHREEREWQGEWEGDLAPRRILAAQDFSRAGDAALAFATVLAAEHQAELHLLHVVPEDYPETPPGFEFIEQQLEEMVSEEARLWCTVKPAVRAGRPAEEILTLAEQEEMDLICLGRHREEGEWRELFGTNTDFVLRQATCPVLVAPPGPQPAARE
ncbi:MAG: universal stress protein [Blastocatellia bacterium]